tara:strand:+ start:2550 stop:2744 length:195 start_codon:yes stop_codon:yes gene_type:complete
MMGFFEVLAVVFLGISGQAYQEVPFKGYPPMKAIFLNEYQCNEVKTKKEKCVRFSYEYVGLFEK